MRSRTVALVALLSVLLVIPATAWASRVLVPDASDSASPSIVSLFDTATNLRTGEFTAGRAMLGVAITPDGRTGYVVGAGSKNLIPVDLTQPTLVASPWLDLSDSSPAYIAISPDGRKAYVPDGGNRRVLVIDLTGVIPVLAGTIAVGGSPHGVAFTPDGAWAYVADFADGTVTPINAMTNTAGAPISVGIHPDQLAITPDGATAYVTDNGSNVVYPIAVPAGTVGTPITVGGSNVHPLGIAITPDGTKAYSANNGTDSTAFGNGITVTPITIATNTAGTPILAGTPRDLASGPWAVAITPDSKTAYVASWRGVYPIDIATGVAADPIAVGVNGRSLAIPPDQGPTAALSITTGAPGSATAFDASASTVQEGTIAAYDWDFGDGTTASTTGPTTTHVYANAGTYTVTLVETDSAGTSDDTFTYTGQTASRVGNPRARISGSATVSDGQGPTVVVTPRTPDVVVTPPAVPTQGAVSGVVSDSTVAGNPPLPSSTVQLCGPVCLGAYTDGAGRFTFASVPPGHYIVQVDPPSRSTLAQGSRVVDVVAGATADASVRLQRNQPLPKAMTFTTGTGVTSSGKTSTVNWTDSFAFNVPPIKAFGARGTPNSSVATSMIVKLTTSGDNQVVLGSVLSFELYYDAAGKPKAATATDTPIDGLIDAGFDFELGDLAVPAGDSVTADPAALATATRVVAKSAGLQAAAHGTLVLSITPLHDERSVAALEAARPTATAADACDEAQTQVVDLEFKVHMYEQMLAGARYELANGIGDRADAQLKEHNAERGIKREQFNLDVAAGVARDVCADADPPCPEDDNIFGTTEPCPVIGMIAVDPSGFVVTRKGVPLEHAKVVLERSVTATGTFTAPPDGDAVMSVTNRKNPDFTDLDGHFGWDVFPGYYRVRATLAGCKASTVTKAFAVPPPVTNLRLVLNCKGPKRAASIVRVTSVRGSVVTLAVRAGRKAAIGMVTLKAGKVRTFAFLDRRGRARVSLPGRVKQLTVSYPGNARFAPSRTVRR